MRFSDLLSRLRGSTRTKIDLAITMAAKAASAVFGGIGAIVVAYDSGQAALGLYTLMRVAPSIYVLATELGISNAYPFLISRERRSAGRVYGSGVFALACVAVVQIGLWAGLSPWLSGKLFPGVSVQAVFAVGLVAPLQVIILHVANLMRAIQQVRLANLLFVLIELLVACLLFVVCFAPGDSIDHMAYAVVSAYLIVSAIAVASANRIGFPFVPVFDRTILVASVRYGLRTQAGNAFQILNYRADQLIIGAAIGPRELGLYAVAAKAAELARFVSTSIVFVVEPLLARATHREAGLVVRRNYWKVFSVNLVFVAIGVVVAPFAFPVLFGSWAAESVLPFLIISLGMVIAGANGLIGSYNFAVGRPESNTRVIFAGLICTVVGNVMLTPVYGVLGAAGAALATQLAVTALFALKFISDDRVNSRSE